MALVVVASKYITMDDGEQSAMIIGILKMPKLCVVNLVIQMLLEHFLGIRFFLGLDGLYGLMKSTVLETNKILQVVPIPDGGILIAGIPKMLVQNVLQQVISKSFQMYVFITDTYNVFSNI